PERGGRLRARAPRLTPAQPRSRSGRCLTVTTAEQLQPPVSSDARPVVPRAVEARDGAAPQRAPGSRWSTLAVALVALSPFLVGAVSSGRRGFPPGALFGDRALLALSAGDAWRAPVLLGPYSRFYWHHPGPLYFYVLDAWSTVVGGQTVGLVLGVVAINL